MSLARVAPTAILWCARQKPQPFDRHTRGVFSSRPQPAPAGSHFMQLRDACCHGVFPHSGHTTPKASWAVAGLPSPLRAEARQRQGSEPLWMEPQHQPALGLMPEAVFRDNETPLKIRRRVRRSPMVPSKPRTRVAATSASKDSPVSMKRSTDLPWPPCRRRSLRRHRLPTTPPRRCCLVAVEALSARCAHEVPLLLASFAGSAGLWSVAPTQGNPYPALDPVTFERRQAQGPDRWT